MRRERRTIYFSGRVQGVGFRWTTVQALAALDLAGYVRNLPDGRVELVMEGLPAETLQGALRVRRALSGYISEAVESVAPATGEFMGFGVRR
ncbi:MAG: acylphosphatase [Candidatus Binatia bacterium]